ncbi:DUF4266 domain-containing protein [Sphingomonas sp. URHD0057]|uniref:DUF4266 domain-containing protein n=1 Tax=Sphingomonas sp. URHD0057 TaxID=1380389 RepID=UPI00048C1E97|nr:DUF4266 domain-containing protein [Sphingomonas sp. URHD0057]
MTPSLRTIIAALAPLLASACASVEPWQRGTLAKPHMALDPHPQRTALLAHVRAAREAASGGVTKDGGGCGCD